MKSNGEKKLLVMLLNELPANNIFYFQNLIHSLSNTESYHLLSLSSPPPPPPPPSPLLLLSADNLVVLAIKPVVSSIK